MLAGVTAALTAVEQLGPDQFFLCRGAICIQVADCLPIEPVPLLLQIIDLDNLLFDRVRTAEILELAKERLNIAKKTFPKAFLVDYKDVNIIYRTRRGSPWPIP